MSLAPWWKW